MSGTADTPDLASLLQVLQRSWNTQPQRTQPVTMPFGAVGSEPPLDPDSLRARRFMQEGTPGFLSSVFPMLGMAPGLATGFFDLSQGPRTGNVTPEGTAALLALVDPLASRQEGVLSAFSGSQRAAREAAIEARAAQLRGDTPLDRTIAATQAQQQPFSLLSGLEVAPGEADRVSTRIPTAVTPKGQEPLNPHSRADLNIGIDAARDSTDAFQTNALNMRDPTLYPDLPVKGMRNADNIAEAAIEHMKDNILALHDGMLDAYGPDTLLRASKWYAASIHRVGMCRHHLQRRRRDGWDVRRSAARGRGAARRQRSDAAEHAGQRHATDARHLSGDELGIGASGALDRGA